MKRSIIIAGLFFSIVSITACSKKNAIIPISGTISGKPAITLYGSSNEPTDYVLIDTVTADKKISYDGVVFNYIYELPSSNIFIINTNIPAARGTLTLTGPKIVLAIDTGYTIRFASTQYTAK